MYRRTDKETIGATKTSFNIVEALEENDGATLSELAELTDTSKSTVYRHLQTLKQLRYVVEEDHKHFLGSRFLKISEKVRNRHRGYPIAKRIVFELAKETDERSLFLIVEDGEGVYLSREGGVYNSTVGERRPLHTIASGRAILAQWSDEEISAYIDEYSSPERTADPIEDPVALREKLAEILECGYSLSNEEFMNGLRALAVPVFTPENEILGSLGFVGPTSRFKDEYVLDRLLGLLQDKANEVKIELHYD